MYKQLKTTVFAFVTGLIIGMSSINIDESVTLQEPQTPVVEASVEPVTRDIVSIAAPVVEEPIPEVVEETTSAYSREDLELLTLVTMAEAEGESELGQRLVVDTILNRVDSPYYGDTVSEVVYQKGQFSSMWNGRVDRCYVKEEILQIVKEEVESRTNSEVIYFRTDHYSSYGIPLFKEGNHYFSAKE